MPIGNTLQQSCSKTAEYLPDCWQDDERMSCLMAMFKNRSVNPLEYDSKLKFWSNLIQASCSALKRPYFSYSDLVSRFKRKDRIPAGLGVVIKDMLEKGDVITSENYALNGAGWISWTLDLTLKKPLSWLLGLSDTDVTKQEFIAPKILDELCHNVMEIWRENQQSGSPTDLQRAGIIEYRKFVKLIAPHGFDEKSIDLITEQLKRLSLVSIDTGDRGEKLIKFVESDSQDEKTPITDTDRNFYKLQKTIEMLEADLLRLEDNALKLDTDARIHIRAQNRAKAKQCLRQKLSILKQIKHKEAACNNCVTLMNQLTLTKEQKQILDAFKAGVDAFKADMARHGLSPDKIGETMDDVHEAIYEQADINEAISRSPIVASISAAYSDPDLEQELADLLKESEMNDMKGAKLPETPKIGFPETTTNFATSTPLSKTSSGEEDNLARLRRLLESE